VYTGDTFVLSEPVILSPSSEFLSLQANRYRNRTDTLWKVIRQLDR